ncbi:GNAT family N-acetyltransferase [uncultured Sphingomonas sp.]|uniref:GNAT family N-acetyltransferase n=1 Tax=uncultured Sphingomonas sp. TaxID=158754 RepID=UPI0035C988D2
MHHLPLDQADPAAVERLLDQAFGPDRHARTAYKVRGPARAVPELSFAAFEGDVLVGTVQCWPVALLADDGGAHPLTMVGPVAVDPVRQRSGLGRALMACALAEAEATGADEALTLIGDPEYYGRFFGFSADRTARWRLPGPVEPRRLLARGDAVPDLAGVLGPRDHVQTSGAPALDARAAAA